MKTDVTTSCTTPKLRHTNTKLAKSLNFIPISKCNIKVEADTRRKTVHRSRDVPINNNSICSMHSFKTKGVLITCPNAVSCWEEERRVREVVVGGCVP